ncbi:hypothetical protein [Streptomyces viridosporus]|uniref:hypothetical protein n=1 Tax=Streptomyces viridosporus TaxID=67581 RepID=UPI0037034573
MRTRTTIAIGALLLAALTACSSGSDDKPDEPNATATATKTVDQAAARQACIDAWAEALQDAEVSSEDEPAACDGLPEGDKLDRYMEGLAQRNEANRDEVQDCLDDPTCTSMPIP